MYVSGSFISHVITVYSTKAAVFAATICQSNSATRFPIPDKPTVAVFAPIHSANFTGKTT